VSVRLGITSARAAQPDRRLAPRKEAHPGPDILATPEMARVSVLAALLLLPISGLCAAVPTPSPPPKLPSEALASK
jgi:hypothetical protein